MIRFDDFSSLGKILRGNILSEINKVNTIENQYDLEDYFQEIADMVAKYYNVKFAIVLNSRLLNMHLILKVLNCGSSDEAILSTYNLYETATAVLNAGAQPVFVDINNDLTINTDLISLEITKKTKVIINNHFIGFKHDYDNINKISGENNIPFIECANDYHAATFQADKLGELGVGCINFTTSSFFGIGGEVSIILLNNKDVYSKLKNKICYPMITNCNYYKVALPVILDPISVAVFKTKFCHIGRLQKRFEQIVNSYRELFPQDIYLGHNYIYVKKPGRLFEFLERKEVEIKPGYACLHLNKEFFHKLKNRKFLNTEKISASIFKLPIHMGLCKKDMKFICENIKQYLNDRLIHDSHKRMKDGKFTYFKDGKVFTLFKNKEEYVNTKKGYDYFSNITDVPKTKFKEENNKMIMVAELIQDEQYDKDRNENIKNMGTLLADLHKKSKKNISGTLYDFLITKDYYPRHNEILGLLDKFRAHFQDQFANHIHSDFSINNLLFKSNKIYLVDLSENRIFDRYSDFAAVYLNTCHENNDQFSLFLKSYSNGGEFYFSNKRLYINILMRKLNILNSKYERKRYSSRIVFDYYYNKLIREGQKIAGQFNCISL